MASRDVMISAFLIVLCAIRSVAHASSEQTDSAAPVEESVVTLDHSNFTDFVAKHKFIVVEFYAPWCGACKQLAPEYEKAASILSKEDPSLVLAKVDATEEQNKGLSKEHGLSGYPTLKILRYGGSVVQDYKGPREANGIVAYVKKQSGPASVEIKSAEEAASFIDDKKLVVVGVFPEFSGEKFDNFTTVAERLRIDYDFGHVLDAKLLPRGESSVSGPIVRLFKSFDELFVDFQEFNVDALVVLIEESSIPTVTVFNNDQSNHPFVIKFFNTENDKAMLFLNFSSENFDAFKSKYHDVANQYKGQGIGFLIGDVDASERAFQFFGLKEDQVPLIFIQKNEGEKYLKTKLEPGHIASLLKEYKDGHLQPFKKSQPIPEVNNEPVKVVVHDNLQDFFFKSGKNVLLEFYAPWSEQELAPILDEVAVSFENDADVVIAKFDGTANDFPEDVFDIQGFPTLYFKSASGKIVLYDGGRSKEDLIDFIKNNSEKVTLQESPKDEL